MCFVTFAGYPLVTSMLVSAWFSVGVVVLFVAPAWHREQSVTLCMAWLPVAGPLGAIAGLWQAVQSVVTPQIGVVVVPDAYTFAWQVAVEHRPL